MTVMGEQNLMLDDIWGIEQRLDELPTADVVEIVRCKDCKYFIPKTGWGVGQCSYLEDKLEVFDVIMLDNDYCGEGKRKKRDKNND